MQQKIKNALAKSQLLSGFGFEQQQFALCRFHRGNELTDEHDGILSAGLIVSGRADVYSISPDGGETILSTLSVGDCFGISNLFGQELVTRIICPISCEVAFISKEAVREKLFSDSAFAERYMRLLNNKITFLTTRVAILTAQSSRAKLAHYLISRCDSQNLVQLSCSKEQLAKSLDMSRAALFREFALLTKEGVIESEKDTVKILKADELSKFITSKKERGNI